MKIYRPNIAFPTPEVNKQNEWTGVKASEKLIAATDREVLA